ncbi:MAG: ClbS/DfsB family four-helix bundle protein [Cyclobacteriaceae bacterium]
MPRPKSKSELLELSKHNYNKLLDYIQAMDMAEQKREFPQGTMNRNIRDVLMHLHHWHLMMLDWYKTGMAGEQPDMPAKGYTWKTTSALNRWIWEKYSKTSLSKAKESFSSSYQQVRKVIQSHSDKELFEKKRYKWTGSTSLGAYLISSTSSHYDWALKLIKKAKK